MDLNADLGESWYAHRIGADAELMPLLDSCNVACGFHGGDAVTLRNTIDLALEHDVAIGAHPSFPDRKNFGRKTMEIPAPDLYALLLYQVAALKGMV
ncbi:MAG: LamB/YcsF family protein, partial [Bacteroidota bacterium]